MTFASEMDDFLRLLMVEKNYSTHTIEHYKRDLLRFSAYLESVDLQWNKVTAKHLRDYVSRRFFEGVKSRTLQRELSSMRGFYRHCIARGSAESNPTLGVRPPKSGKKLPETLTIEQVASLL